MKNFHRLLFLSSLLLFIFGFSKQSKQSTFENSPKIVMIKLTFQVDMKYQEVHPDGVFLSCNILNGYAQTKMQLHSSSIWTITIDAPIGYEVLWKYLNGPDAYEPNNDLELCSIDGGFSGSIRTHITGIEDEVLPAVCYGQCTTCSLTNITQDTWLENAISFSPNPAVDKVFVKYDFDKPEFLSLRLHDTTGRLTRSWELGNVSNGQQGLALDGLGAGVYWVEVLVGEKKIGKRLVVGN